MAKAFNPYDALRSFGSGSSGGGSNYKALASYKSPKVRVSKYDTPTDTQAQAQPQQSPQRQQQPQGNGGGFWHRLAQAGSQAVQVAKSAAHDVVEEPAKVGKAAIAGGQGLVDLGRAGVAKATGNQAAANAAISRGLKATSPIAKPLDSPSRFLKSMVGTGAAIGSELAPIPIGKAVKGASLVTRLGKASAGGAAASGIGSAGSQLANEGKISPKQVAKSAAFGGALGALMPAAGAAKKTLMNRIPTAEATNRLSASGVAKIGEARGGDASSLINTVKSKASSLYTKTLDRYNPLVKLGKAVGQRDTVENALAGHYGAGSTANYHLDEELKPLLSGVNSRDFRDYLISARDKELAGRGIKGSDAQAADQVMTGLKQSLGDEGVASLKQRADKLYDYQRGLVNEYLVKPGVLSKESADAMFNKNKAYVPFKRVTDALDEKLGGVPGNKAIATSQNVIKGIKGSDKQIVDPLQSIVENTYKIVSLGRQNEVGKALAKLQPQLGDDVMKPISQAEAAGKPTISVFDNGKKQLYHVAPEVAESAKALNEEQMNTLVKILAAPTRVFRATATGANPEFAIPNVTRDLQTAFVTAGLNPLKWVSGLAHYIKGDDIYKEFLKSGGQTSRMSLDTNALKKTVNEITGEGRGISVASPKSLYRMLEKVGEASEQPTRIAAFQKEVKARMKQGLSQEEANKYGARAAQEVSVNFARRGSATQAANALYAFMNARAQGTDRLLRSFKAHPAGVSTRLGLMTVAPAISLYAYNRKFPNYNDPRIISPTDKQNNFIMMAPWLGKDRYIKIPKGDIGKLANPVEAFLEHVDGKGGSVAKSLGQALSAFSPMTNVGDAIPTTLRPPVEVAANKNFFTGKEIVPSYKKDYPAAAQFGSGTPAIYRMIGDKLNISPAKAQDVLQGYLTGYARMGETATNAKLPDKYKTGQREGADDINNALVGRRFAGGAKMSPEEYATSVSKQINSLDFSKSDLKSGLNRGDITKKEYDLQLNKLVQKQNKIKTDAQQQGYGDLLNNITKKANHDRAVKAAQTRKANKKKQ